MRFTIITAFLLSIFFLSCTEKSPSKASPLVSAASQNKGKAIITKMVAKVGDYKALLEKKDVSYTYTYQTPNGKADISTEKYIFDGELSYGTYQQHQRTFPELRGLMEQGYDGSKYWLKHKGDMVNDSARLAKVAFNRHTNFYWFAMMQKQLDPGLNYEYIGEKSINGKDYDIVKVSFDSNEKPKDIYQLYINKKTDLVDQFLFTVAEYDLMDTPFLMVLQYEDVDGILIPTKRAYKKSTWNADITENPWVKVTWTDVKFNNGLNAADFKSQ